MHICGTTSEPPSNHMLHCFVRLRSHAAGTFRDSMVNSKVVLLVDVFLIHLNHHGHNANLDYASAIVGVNIKKKYGDSLSCGDLFVFARW